MIGAGEWWQGCGQSRVWGRASDERYAFDVPAETAEDRIVLSFDGKGIAMTLDGLREATSKAAARAR